jgi:N-acetylglucosaminyl-diphospho-decaprenol L-rhamnosyltransferase
LADVAVTLVCINELANVRSLLDDLRAQAGVELEIVVVDNGSTDGTLEFLAAQPDVQSIANPENRWLVPAQLQGLLATSAPYVLSLNADTALPEPDMLTKLIAALEADPGAGLAGPRLEREDGFDLANGAFRLPTARYVIADVLGIVPRRRRRRAAPIAGSGDETRAVPLVNGAIMLERRAALEQIGLLDDRFLLYWEEVDLCKRLGDAGWRILLVPSACGIHRVKGSPTSAAARNEVWEHGERLYLRKHFGVLAGAAVVAARRLQRLRARLKRKVRR